jgi:3-hydroxy-9,10-secoandrosta-1,3,5(10)-triene-9,17-dione monooxygenase
MAAAINSPQSGVSDARRGHAPENLVAMAKTIATSLTERQAETEERTFYGPDTHREFAKAGFYRILVPRRYGGYEYGLETFLRVAMELTRGCPSTGWMYCIGAAHALAAATMFDEQAQDELFSSGDFICPMLIQPSGSAERVGGEWVLNGTWRYASGSPYATHFIGHTIVSPDNGQPPAPMLFVMPRDQWQRLDDWSGQLGLKGSGSHSILVENGRIPGHFALPGTHISETVVVGGTPGRDLHNNPEYGGGPLSVMNLEAAFLAVGMAQGALDAYEELMRSKTTMLPPMVNRAKDPDYQFWYGEAAGLIGTAEAAAMNAVRQWSDLCAQGPEAFTREHDLRLSAICRHVMRLCWHAVQEYLFPTAGSSAVRHGERIERVWRDMSMFHSHLGISVLLPTVAVRELAQVRLGS